MSDALSIAAILSGLSEVRADIAADEVAARDEGLDGIANAYALAGARLAGAIRGIQSRTNIRTLPPHPNLSDAVFDIEPFRPERGDQ